MKVYFTLIAILFSLFEPLKAQILVMETGEVSINHTVTSVVLTNTFIDPVVIALPASYNGAHEATVRLENVTGTGFDLYLEEPIDKDGPHTLETVHYIVVEKGRYTFDDGTMLEAGTVSSSDLGFQTVTLLQTYGAVPAIFTQVQTNNSATNFLKTRQRSSTVSDFDVKLEREESLNAIVPSGSEDIGYFAISKGGGILDGIIIEANSFTLDETIATRVFTESFSPGNHMVASIATTFGGDPANLRWTAFTATEVDLFIDEDISNDGEVDHIFETVDYFVIDGGEMGVFLPVLLPIELLSFEATLNKDNSVDLEWVTASERNNAFFSVERSRDGITWSQVLTVDGAGNSSETICYNNIDKKPYPGVSYYRLKQVDFDGNYSYSDIRSVVLDLAKLIAAYPIPSKSHITLLINTDHNSNSRITIYNMSGSIIDTFELNIEAGLKEYVLNLSDLSAGVYWLAVDFGNDKPLERIKIQIQ